MTLHDAGGKSRWKLPPGVTGEAAFDEANRSRRLWLTRCWGDPRGPYAACIGMNPSVAEADVDDPTVRRDIEFAKREGCTWLVKLNVMDYRATNPAELVKPGVFPCGPRNRQTIINFAKQAAVVIVGWGVLPLSLRAYADRVVADLRSAGVEMWCLGTSKAGFPRHPLYVRGDTPLIRFEGTP